MDCLTPPLRGGASKLEVTSQKPEVRNATFWLLAFNF
jgi:hypothetical protein